MHFGIMLILKKNYSQLEIAKTAEPHYTKKEKEKKKKKKKIYLICLLQLYYIHCGICLSLTPSPQNL